MDKLLVMDTGYVPNPALLRDPANLSWILDISIHTQDYRKEDVVHGSHSRVKESGPVNVVRTLEDEFKAQRGQTMVSREPSSTAYARR